MLHDEGREDISVRMYGVGSCRLMLEGVYSADAAIDAELSRNGILIRFKRPQCTGDSRRCDAAAQIRRSEPHCVGMDVYDGARRNPVLWVSKVGLGHKTTLQS